MLLTFLQVKVIGALQVVYLILDMELQTHLVMEQVVEHLDQQRQVQH